MKRITKIVITGGPCAGKSTALLTIREHFEARGYTVLTIAETATELINGGITPWGCQSHLEFQNLLSEVQLAKEKVFDQVAQNEPNQKVLIVCDRGLLDNKAYLNQQEFEQYCQHLQMTEEDMVARYDAVFHLQSAAIGAQKYYTFANNTARVESIEQATDLDIRHQKAAQVHPYFYLLDNRGDFDDKMKRLIKEIESFLIEKASQTC